MNVIVLVIDTLRYDHIGANGNNWIRTPNFDRFASEGTVFDNSYAASYPTIPHRTDVITGRYGDPFHPWLPLPYDAETLPGALARHGGATQLLCDTPHLINGGHNFDYPFHAWHFIRGNEVDRHWLDDRTSELPPEKHARYVRPDGVFYPTVMQYIRNNRGRAREEEWPSPRLFADACRWLQDNRRRDNFFLWMDCFDPHEPWDPPAHYVEMYDETFRKVGDLNVLFGWETACGSELSAEQLVRVRAHYAGEVTMVDRWFGRMLDTLDALGLAGNTAVIVTSDHGTNLGAHGQLQKGYPLWEQVAHTVLMARVPGKAGGVRRREPVQPQDIFPTVCALSGAEVPSSVEGHSLAGMLGSTEATEWPRTVAVSGRAYDLRRDAHPVVTVQTDEWCLLDSTDPSSRLLYHKPTDPQEETNVADEHPEVVEELHQRLLAELEGRGAPPALIDWFATGTKGPVPDDYRPRPAYLEPYRVYWTNILPEEKSP